MDDISVKTSAVASPWDKTRPSFELLPAPGGKYTEANPEFQAAAANFKTALLAKGYRLAEKTEAADAIIWLDVFVAPPVTDTYETIAKVFEPSEFPFPANAVVASTVNSTSPAFSSASLPRSTVVPPSNSPISTFTTPASGIPPSAVLLEPARLGPARQKVTRYGYRVSAVAYDGAEMRATSARPEAVVTRLWKVSATGNTWAPIPEAEMLPRLAGLSADAVGTNADKPFVHHTRPGFLRLVPAAKIPVSSTPQN
ncbi:MAG TPA: hypothetical protein VHO24_13440 [Opitutaceae bacterium]|nr:hypothetical protein [Opitutaceae bacterium]